ncbi:MAG: hypothetical protein CL908_16980 [Deltaproteobacteria bacterium]|jgi:hypothetical protein|nr:hypothetical protein [Deltaproteobacteria bacterium]
MSIQIEETFQIAVPVETVWEFLLDPHQVVTCMPGAELEKVIDDRTFDGAVKIKLGAVTMRYRGRVQLTEVDEQQHSVGMLAEAREASGGTLKAKLNSEVRALPDGQTEVVTSAQVDLTGRAMQIGRGMIQGVSAQLFAQFVDQTRQTLEAAASESATSTAVPAPAAEESIPLLRIILGVIWAPVANFFRRIFGQQRDQ